MEFVTVPSLLLLLFCLSLCVLQKAKQLQVYPASTNVTRDLCSQADSLAQLGILVLIIKIVISNFKFVVIYIYMHHSIYKITRS